MKYQLNLPRKYTAMGQLWVSLLLIVLAAILAFTPLLTIDVSSTADAINTLMAELGSEGEGEIPEFEIPEKVDVTTGKLVTSINIFTKFLSATITGATSENKEEAEEAMAELEELINSKEGQEALVMAVALVAGVVDFDELVGDMTEPDTDDNDNNDDANNNSRASDDADVDDPDAMPDMGDVEEDVEGMVEDAIGTAVNTMINVGILFYLLAFVLVWPIIMAIIALVMLIKALCSIKDPAKNAGKLGGSLLGALGVVVTTTLLLTFLPNVELGSGLIAILVFSLVSLAINITVTRLRAYNPLDFKFVNVVQGTGLVKAIGVIVFFTSVLKTGFLRGFINDMSAYIVEAGKQVADINADITTYNQTLNFTGGKRIEAFAMGSGYVIDLALIVVAAILALSVCVTLVKNVAAQLGLTCSKKKGKPGVLTTGIFALITCILPVAASKLENRILYPKSEIKNGVLKVTEEVDGAIFQMSEDGEAALVGMFVGAILVLVADIAYLVLRKVFCGEMSKEEQKLVLAGAAAEVAVEASVEEPVAEEAVVEEAVVEEPVAEEPVADEAEAAPEAGVVDEAVEETADETENV